MQNNKACGPDGVDLPYGVPDGVPVEAIRLLMQYNKDRLPQVMNYEACHYVYGPKSFCVRGRYAVFPE